MEIEFRRVVDSLPELVWTIHPDGRGEFVNRRWCEYTGLSPEKALDHGWRSAIHPDDLTEFLGRSTAVMRSDAPDETEVRLRRFDGEHRWFAVRFAPLSEGANGVAGWCLSAAYSDERGKGATGSAASDRRLQRFVDGLPTQVILMTPSLELEFVNRQVEDYYGKSLEELKQWASSGAIHPDDLPAVHERLSRLVAKGEPYDAHHRMLRADGVYRWVRSRMVPSRDAQGNVVRYCSIQTDVHDLKQAEDLLAGEVRLLEMVARGRPLLEVLDALSHLVEDLASGCLCSILMVAPDGMHFQVGGGPSLPDAYNRVLHGLPIDPCYGPCSLAVVTKVPIITADLVNDPRWRSSAWPPLVESYGYASCWSMPIMSGDGRVLGVFALYRREPVGPTNFEHRLIERFTSIAGIAIERAQSDVTLRENEARKAAILDSSLDCIVTIDDQGRITEFNPAAERTFGWAREAVLGAPIAEVIIPPALRDQHRLGFERYLATGRSQVLGKRVEMTALRADGGEFPVELAISRIPIAGPPAFSAHLRDITERKKAEDDLRRSQAYLAQAQRLSLTGSFGWRVFSDEHFWSDETFRIFGLDSSAGVSMPKILDLLHPEDVALAHRVIVQAKEGEDFDLEVRALLPDGALKHLHVVGRVMQGPDGRWEHVGAVQDVTEAKLAEAALTASEAELRRANSYLTEAQRLSQTGSFTWDVLTDEHNWSAEIRRIFGFDPDAKVTMSMILGAIYPEDMAEVEQVIGGALEGRDFELVFRIITTAGEVRHAHVVGHRIGDIADRPVFLGALRDVTDSKVTEAALRASEADLRRANRYLTEAQRMSRTGSWTYDPTTREGDFSEELVRIWEFASSKDITLEACLAYTHPEDAWIIAGLYKTMIDTGEDFDVFYRAKLPSGVIKHLHMVGKRLPEITDRFVYVGATQDVTESKMAEEALKASEAELRRANSYLTTAQRLSKTGSFTWDLDADQRQWSEEMYRIFEMEAETGVPGAMTWEFIHPDDLPVIESLMLQAREGRDFDGAFRLLLPSGAIKNLRVVGHRLNDNKDRPVFVGAAQDVTELRRGEEALSQARAELAHVARVTTLSALTASIAHEVSQPLSGILNNANTCLRMLAADPPNLDGAAETARRTIRDTNRAHEVIKRLRALFAKKAPAMEPLDLGDVAREVIALSSNELHRGRVVVQTDFAEDLPFVSGDRIQLQQVILNLLLNAADAMAAVGDRPRTLLVQTHFDDEKVRLSVKDVGVGIEVQVIEKLFNAFYTTKANGMGVGLAISRSIIESHEGRLWATPNDGPGATFYFSIPYAPGAAPRANPQSLRSKSASLGQDQLARNA